MYEAALLFASDSNFGVLDAAFANHFAEFDVQYETFDIISAATQVG
jgi:hypothetical protein